LSTVKRLIDAGAIVSLPNRNGETAIELAKQMGYDQIVDYLKQRLGPNGYGQIDIN
jgi:ankyrin repeat protein